MPSGFLQWLAVVVSNQLEAFSPFRLQLYSMEWDIWIGVLGIGIE